MKKYIKNSNTSIKLNLLSFSAYLTYFRYIKYVTTNSEYFRTMKTLFNDTDCKTKQIYIINDRPTKKKKLDGSTSIETTYFA